MAGRLLDAQDLLGLRERVERFLMLTVLVQLLAVGAILFHFIHLRRSELRVLGERIVDFFHFRRAVKRECAAGEEQRGSKQSATNLHGFSSPLGVQRTSRPPNRPTAASISQPATFASPPPRRPLIASGRVTLHTTNSYTVR